MLGLGVQLISGKIEKSKKSQSWKKINGQTALSLTPQAMYNQFKRPSAGSVRELYYIDRKILGLMSHVTVNTRMAT